MGLTKKPYKGTRDFYPTDKRLRDYIFEKLSKTAESFGYESYDGPLLEELELYKAKSGEELINEQIYSFVDRGKRDVAIRPEMTPTLARMIASSHRELAKPIRWFSIPNLLRYERPQRGRLREHWQFNCDIFGAPALRGEVEILQILIGLMTNLGADQKDFTILINDRQIVDFLFKQLLKLDSETAYKLYKVIDKSKKLSEEKLQQMLETLELSDEKLGILNDYLKLNSFETLEAFAQKYKLIEQTSGIKFCFQSLSQLNQSSYLTYDPSIVRGLDYYTGIVFECFDKDPQNPRAICGGGAYADLLKIFDEPTLPGIGFGLGDVTLTHFLQTHNLLPDFSKPTIDLFVSFQIPEAESAATQLSYALREQGLQVVNGLEPIKINKVFSTAEKRGAKQVAFIGEDELKANTVQIKNLASKQQQTVNLKDIDKLKDLLR